MTELHPEIVYESVKTSGSPIAENDQQAINNATALQLVPGERLKTELTADDPRYQGQYSLANYKLFRFSAPEVSEYRIELRTLCNCFGLDKFIVYPVARVIDSKGTTINDEWSYVGLQNPDWSYPVNILAVWEGSVDAAGDYYFLVHAYNDQIGGTYLTYSDWSPESRWLAEKIPGLADFHRALSRIGMRAEEDPEPGDYPMWAYPTGKLAVTLTLENDN